MRLVVLVTAIGCSQHPSNGADAPAVVVDGVAADAAPLAADHAHGMFVLDPPTLADEQAGRCGTLGSNCYTDHVAPTLIAGSAAAGAVFQVQWAQINPANGTYDFSALDTWMQPWSAAGKLTSFVFSPVGFEIGEGYAPAWYKQRPTIASASQTGGIIAIQTSTDVGFFPGGVASGLEVQIAGTATALDGLWTVCDHATSGCQDPTARTIYAIGAGPNVASVTAGTIGNPMYGATCDTGPTPIEWRINFIKAWQDVIAHAASYYGTNDHVAYLRFGMGLGGQTNPINVGSASPTSCEAEMDSYGFSSVAAPWPLPTSAQWPPVTTTWVGYLKAMLQYVQSLHTATPILLTLSPIMTTGDNVTPDAVALDAVAAGVGLANQGLQHTDIADFNANQPCLGGDWCANFEKLYGQVPMELQTISASDPTGTVGSNRTGSLATLVPFAIERHTRILELYVQDWLCTFDATWSHYGDCATAGYPATFASAAAALN